ncbi:hypothetical protein SDC9_102781 [bioreactor metagenome]|uniref:Uncharacterized protein n=1 Tax=bioreactor metagenome TaxID=1076179 RepID=A0A645AYM5_9ZZZZ
MCDKALKKGIPAPERPERESPFYMANIVYDGCKPKKPNRRAKLLRRLFLSLSKIAVPLQRTALALGGPGGAGVPSEQHHAVAEI